MDWLHSLCFDAQTYLAIYIKDASLMNQCLFAFPRVNVFHLEFCIKEPQ